MPGNGDRHFCCRSAISVSLVFTVSASLRALAVRSFFSSSTTWGHSMAKHLKRGLGNETCSGSVSLICEPLVGFSDMEF